MPLDVSSAGSAHPPSPLGWGAARLHPESERLFLKGLDYCGSLPEVTAAELHPWVRAKFLELWALAQMVEPF
ncbi:MAG: hypothetical protein IV100_18860 [Myxococcales bacterium]|nr:hypothetical protein [Myxococcales bacterium]